VSNTHAKDYGMGNFLLFSFWAISGIMKKILIYGGRICLFCPFANRI
jgi:hypothetical protein